MTNTHKVLELIRKNPEGLDDDEISEMSGVRPRQQIYQICTRLEAAGHIWRESLEKAGKRKKIHNFPVEDSHGTFINGQRVEEEFRPAPGGSPRTNRKRWQQRLSALVAATGQGEDELLDQALQALAMRVLEKQGGK